MPTISSTDAETQLRMLMTSPQASADTFSRPSTEAENDFADQPNKEAILHYMVTGQMPKTVRPLDNGLIGRLGTMVGLYHPQAQPISQYTQDRAAAARSQYQQIPVEQKLREMQTIMPGVQQFGSNFGRAAMHQIDPSLENAFPPGMKGKGDIQEEGEQLRHMGVEQANQIKLMQAQTQQVAAEARAALASGNAELAQQKMQLVQMLDEARIEKMQSDPIDKARGEMTTDLRVREEGINKRIDSLNSLGVVPDTDPRMVKLQSQLDEIQGQRTRLMGTAGKAKSIDELLRAMMPTTTAPVASKGPPTLPKGIFSGPEPGSTDIPAPATAPPPPTPSDIPGTYRDPKWFKKHPRGKHTSTLDIIDEKAAEIRKRRGY